MNKQKIYRPYIKGFTIIEIIVSLTIILLFTGTGVFVYRNISIEKAFQADVDLFRLVLIRTRERAIARDISPAIEEGNDCPNFVGYNVVLNSVNNTAEEQIVCGSDMGDILTIRTSNFRNINLTNFVGDLTVGFTYPLGQLSANISAPVIIRNRTSTRCVNITINSIGPIDVGEEYTCP